MFKRIKNLLDISRYTVEELRTPPQKELDVEYGYALNGTKEIKRPRITSSPNIQYAKIVEIKTTHPLDEFTHDSTQQSLDDTAARN